ncbi:hypothetical protein IMCC3317_13080 [Kordia antarctica]|uniref:TIR domain-containing protein n=1 Tax=Kordia antarctica TaxID=1218801 RepID=A0A7L4ZHE3_9FLAO|nr:toll/interleukin-1 receptor domain-containing protein [Kordia antarctica]QHI35960.1 hypothetical protein IMCC3317_13080 [Kordia antarctica]
MTTNNYEFDIAISFADDDHDTALVINTFLQQKFPKSKIYFYPDQLEETLGVDLKEQLTEIFCRKAKYVIMVISKNYLDKENECVQTEIAACIPRLQVNRHEFLFPLNIDDTKLSEVHDSLKGMTYFEWNHNPEKFAETIENKIKINNKEQQKKAIIKTVLDWLILFFILSTAVNTTWFFPNYTGIGRYIPLALLCTYRMTYAISDISLAFLSISTFLYNQDIYGLTALALILTIIIWVLTITSPDKTWDAALKMIGGFTAGSFIEKKIKPNINYKR